MNMNRAAIWAAGGIFIGAAAAQAVPIHVTHLWHMHQPIYYPYENAVVADSNGRMPYSIVGSVFDGDRQSAYQYWPPAAVSYAHDRGMAHAGSQCSFSGSLAENADALGYTTANYKSARNDKKTSLGNPRLDMVGISYHHSLMPLTCKESMIMQIRLHKEQYMDHWGTSEYSKGFWPPECAFDETIIPALVEEGLEWVIVDNGHLFRTVSDFPWSSASSCKPNAADMVNGSADSLGSEWVQLPNVWAPTKVLAPWSYQPHYVQHVDPETGSIQKIIAVPGGRYEGNENGRGGYGAFKPENVWGGEISANNNASKPMLLLLHSDGDNYGMKNSDAWNGQQNLFLDMVQGNGDFEYTSVQDYLSLYPPAASDVIHVEPGSWIGIDGGTPYYEKWLSSDYQSGTNPDRWSWSVLVAAQNRVILADTLENTYSMNDVEWGIGSDTAKAWHFYLNGETSCYWYWDYSGEAWDGYVTRACNLAIEQAQKVIDRHPGSDNKGPSIFPPQRNYYNPGSYMWDENDPDPSDFTVWSYVDDVSGLGSVTLKWRTDKDGYNPIASIQNETYAGGDEVNAWNAVAMTGSWDPASKVSVCPDPTARAQMFSAAITGQDDVLIDYYIEAMDSLGNVSKSEIIHVAVGDVGPAPDPELGISSVSSYPGPDHADNLTLNPGEDLWIDALTANGPPTLIQVHVSVDSGAWTATAMEANGEGAWHLNLGSFDQGQCVEYYVVASDAEVSATNNNGGANYSICSVSDDTPPSASFDPREPSDCAPIAVTFLAKSSDIATSATVYAFYHFSTNSDDWATAAMTRSSSNVFEIAFATNDVPDNAPRLELCFTDGADLWENNGGSNWVVAIRDCEAPDFVNGVALIPATPAAGESVEVLYNPSSRILAGVGAVNVHHGYNGSNWTTTPGDAMSATGAYWSFTYTIPVAATSIVMCFNDGTTWDNNGGQDWTFAVVPAAPVSDGIVITNPAVGTVTVAYAVTEFNLQGTAGTNLTGNLAWSNALSGGSGQMAHSPHWALPASLTVGDNVITLSGQIAGSGSSVTTTSAVDSAAAYASWTNGSNEGTGFGVWALFSDASAGQFIDADGWGLWSHEGTNLSEAVRTFSSPLAAGDTFHAFMKNGWIWEAGGSIGVALRDGEGATLWEVYFNGGDMTYNTSLGSTDIGWTDAGLDVGFTVTAPGAYAVDLQPVGGTLRQYVGTFAGDIEQFRAWSYNNGTSDTNNSMRDFFFDNLRITRTTSGGDEQYSTAVVHVIRSSGSNEVPVIHGMDLVSGSRGMTVSVADSIPGATYAIYATPMLIPTQNWQLVDGTARIGDGNSIELTHTNAVDSFSFYRIGYVLP